MALCHTPGGTRLSQFNKEKNAMKKQLLLVAGLALAVLSAPAFAEGNGFIRFEAGRSDLDLRVDGVGSGSEKDTTWGLRGGYWFNPNFAVEGFYSQLSSTAVYEGSLKLHGVGVGVVGKKNFGEAHQGFFISGRAGIVRGVATWEYDGSVEEAEAGSVKPYFGVGAGYDFNEKIGLSVNYDQLKGGDDGLDVTARTTTLGLEVRF
ncbi:MAG: outer membrane beta-barrel protein [Pseudoxanthomonas sp.]